MMNFSLMPSLVHRALIKTTILLWNQDYIWALIAHFSESALPNEEEWQIIEDNVIKKASDLLIPVSLKEKILTFIKPIGREIFKWREFHCPYLGIRPRKNLCWTSLGTVDKKKTAELLMKDDKTLPYLTLDITTRYKLACIYCLENDIHELWKRMSEYERKSFYSEDDPRIVDQHELIIFWTRGEVSRMNIRIERIWEGRTTYQIAFEYAAISGNKAATEYFLQKLTVIEKEESLVRATRHVIIRRRSSFSSSTDFPKEHYADVLCFLLSQMDEEQQLEVFKSHICGVFQCFLDWPWQDLFMKTASHVWEVLSERKWKYLLTSVTDKVVVGYTDYDYQKLFGEFWQQSPATHKKYIRDNWAGWFLLYRLFHIEDEENIRLIFSDATVIEKKKFIFSTRGKEICEYLIEHEMWDFLKFFIRECVPSRNDMKKFKEEFTQDLRNAAYIRKQGHLERRFSWKKVKKCFQILNDFIREYSREESEGNGSSSKRRHGIHLHYMKKKAKNLMTKQ
ncbi:hypothetical protein X975_17417, partial [Stegodyphus mimosarum]